MHGVDAQHDFMRVRRQALMARLSARLRGEPDDVGVVLPYDEVIAALGYVSERDLGLCVVELDAIVGSIGRGHDFDRRFRPISSRVRGRWEQIALASRRGQSLPPVTLHQIGEIYFVEDGHHRVSVARAHGRGDIEAYVTAVTTSVGAERAITLADLPFKGHERVFFERVPLPDDARGEISLSDPWQYALLAEGVEAWGFRLMQERGGPIDRFETAQLWLDTEYRPVVAMLRDAGEIASSTETEAYLRIASERYRLLRSHHWSEQVVQRVLEGRRAS
jgi:hypothetical protein